jgi:UDP-glucose 4-epimerase
VKARRILITGVSSQLGGRLAQTLARDHEAEIEALVGIDTEDPRHELPGTEFVRVGIERRPLQRIISAAAIDTVLDTRLIGDPLLAPLGTIHDIDTRQTSELLAACGTPNSTVRRLVLRSSANVYGWEPGDPAFLGEDTVRSHPPRTAIERELASAEGLVREFAAQNPQVRVCTLRFAEEIGGEGRTSLLSLLTLPVIPGMLGFDPRFQLIHHEDVVGALAHAVSADLAGIYNAGADGVLVLSEIASLLGKPLLPVLPPWGAGFAAGQLRRLGLRVPLEMLRQLRYGRGLDNRKLKASGYRLRYTTRETLVRLRAEQRLRPLLGSGSETYRYEPDVEEFLRWSPSVRSASQARQTSVGPPGGYDALGVGELIDLIRSLEPEALRTLREYELEHQGRSAVLEALESTLARKEE